MSDHNLVKEKNIVLLTATITPPQKSNINRHDPQVRLEDYKKALRFYISILKHGIDYIVFVENSKSDISSLLRIVEEAKVIELVEFITFDGLDYPICWGHGYGDFKCVDFAMNHSKIIKVQAGRSIVWKISGRYIVKNLTQFIATKPPSFDVYCDFMTPYFRRGFFQGKYECRMLLVVWTVNGYQTGLQGMYKELIQHKSEFGEQVMRDAMDRRVRRINIVPRFTISPIIEGVAAYYRTNTLRRLKNRFKHYIRLTTRRFAPWLWI